MNEEGETPFSLLVPEREGRQDGPLRLLVPEIHIVDRVVFVLENTHVDLGFYEQGYKLANRAAANLLYEVVRYLFDRGIGTTYKSAKKDLFCSLVINPIDCADSSPEQQSYDEELVELMEYMLEKNVEGFDHQGDRGENLFLQAMCTDSSNALFRTKLFDFLISHFGKE